MQTIDHRWQSNHNISTHTIPCEKEHDCTSSDTVDGQIWHPRSVSRACLIDPSALGLTVVPDPWIMGLVGVEPMMLGSSGCQTQANNKQKENNCAL
jgi:cadmium resistance protein CadD (predicted permease)